MYLLYTLYVTLEGLRAHIRVPYPKPYILGVYLDTMSPEVGVDRLLRTPHPVIVDIRNIRDSNINLIIHYSHYYWVGIHLTDCLLFIQAEAHPSTKQPLFSRQPPEQHLF